MKANELRIGNYVHVSKKWFDLNPELCNTQKCICVEDINRDYINGEDFYYINEYKPDHLEGIPIIEEWLLRFGFKQFLCPGIDKGFTNNKFTLKFYGGEWQGYDVVVKYVHQLQNLYFALTGNELTLI